MPDSPLSAPFSHYHEAFVATAAERAALPADKLVPLNVDVLAATSVVNAAWPLLCEMRPAIEATFRSFDLERYDRLQLYTWALKHAQVRVATANSPPTTVPEMAARAGKLRETLRSDITALAHRGIIDPQLPGRLRGGTGHRAIAFDLQMLAAILREHWSAIASRTMITQAERDQAETLGDALSDAVARRQRASAQAITAADDRLRAFTLFIGAYDEARRAVSYMRWHEEDLNRLLPSVYAGHGGRPGRHASKKQKPAADASPGALPTKAAQGAG